MSFEITPKTIEANFYENGSIPIQEKSASDSSQTVSDQSQGTSGDFSSLRSEINELKNRLVGMPVIQGGTVVTSAIKSSNFNTGVAGWSLDSNGNIEANDGNFRGDITGATGTFSGTVSVASINIGGDDDTSAHIDTDGNFWTGASVANKATAPARIDKNGDAHFSSISLDTDVVLSGLQAGSSLAIQYLTAGSITSKAITLDVTDGSGDSKLQAGKTDFDNTTAGFILGVDDSDSNKAKFYIGDSTNYINWDGTTLNVQGISQVSKSYTAGENLTAGNSVYIEDSSTVDLTFLDTVATPVAGSTFGLSTSTEKRAQSFQETEAIIINKIKVHLATNNSPTDNVKISIQADSSGNPSGSDLASGTIASGSLSGSLTEYTITMGSPYTTTANTTYWVVFSRTGSLDDTNNYSLGRKDDNTSTYANGSQKLYSSASWSSVPADVQVKLITTTVEGRIYKTDATTVGQYESFIGFVKTTTIPGNSCPIIISGEITGLTGLTIGTLYYLSTTRGGITTSSASPTRKCGISTSSTSLLLTNIW